MTITRRQLINAAAAAIVLGNRRDELTLNDMARNLKKWGTLTIRQAEFAKALLERNSDKQIADKNKTFKNHERKWKEDTVYREWILFLARFFSKSRQTAYLEHINGRRVSASFIIATNIGGFGGSCPPWTHCEKLLTSKLVERLRVIYDHPPIYPLGELVAVRRSELTHWAIQKGHDKQMGFITEIEPTPVDAVITYNKTKGGTKTYQIMFPSGSVTLRENQIKLVSRKNHNKG
jgi:hypothetical protein